jgi:peptidyl-prolyl cis-trans isomerase D
MARRGATPQITKKHLARAERERIMRNRLIAGLALVGLVVIGVLAYGVIDIRYLTPLKPVATVNGEKIAIRAFQARVALAQLDLNSQARQAQQLYALFTDNPQVQNQIQQRVQQIAQQLSDTKTLGNQVLETMMGDILVRQEANRRGINVSSDDVEQALEQAYGYYPNGTPTPQPAPTIDATALAALPPTQTATASPTAAVTASPTLTATTTAAPTEGPSPTPLPTATPYTLQAYQQQFQQDMQSLKVFNITEADYRARIEADLYRNRLTEAFQNEIPAIQDQVWARHILVADEATANKVLDLYKSGEDWAKLAAEYSTDTSNKDQAGDLGWFPRGQMVDAFEQAAFITPVGQVAGPIQTSFGWHLILVMGHEERPVSQSILQQEGSTNFNDWLTTTRDAAAVTIIPTWQDYVPAWNPPQSPTATP